MSKQLQAKESKDSKVIQTQKDEERQADQSPAKSLARLEANVARPGDLHSLQKTIGNKTVSDMIQRSKKRQFGAYVHKENYALTQEDKESHDEINIMVFKPREAQSSDE